MRPLKIEKEFLRPFVETTPFSWEDVDYVADRVLEYLKETDRPKYVAIEAVEMILKLAITGVTCPRQEADFWCRRTTIIQIKELKCRMMRTKPKNEKT